MGVSFDIKYHAIVIKEDIPKLSSEWKNKIRKSIENKLSTHPDLYGKPLRRSLKNYWKLRIGDYRVIFRIEKKVVKIFMIQHRSIVYKVMSGRIE